MREPTANARKTYREFRERIIDSLKPRQVQDSYSLEEPHPLQRLRLKVTAFREHLACNGEQMLAQDPEVEPLLRKALAIPDEIRLLPTKSEKLTQNLMFFLPFWLMARRAQALLQSIGTHEGRKLLFGLQVNRTLPGQYYFNPSLDFALLRLEAPRTFEALRDMVHVDFDLMQACYRLGVHRMDEMDRVAKTQYGGAKGALVRVLVELGMIRSTKALEQLPRRIDWFYDENCLTQDTLRKFRQVVQVLGNAGADPTAIVQLLKYPVSRLDPQRLSATLAVLKLNGPQLSVLIETTGEQLLLAKTEQWTFLCEVLRLQSAAEMGRFRRLLDSGRTPSREFSLALLAAGADVAALEVCQSLILSVSERVDVSIPISALQRLLAVPHSLTFAELSKAEDYLMLEHDLEAFLQVLVQHGYGSANNILDFQHCYRRIGANVLHRCLQIAGTCVDAETPAIVAQWVAQAGAGGHIDSFEYLLQSGELRTFHHLQQTLTLAPLGVPMLRYIREDRGVTNLPALRKWYYEEAPGINELRFWSVLDEIQRVLLDDAFERKNFTLLDGNRECVERLINQRIVTSIGAIPFPSDEATLGTYREAKRILLEQIVVELAPRLKNMLTETNGVLVKSLMEHIDEPLEQLRQRIADLAPLLGDLLSGRGPSGAALSDLEADLIAIVYHTTSSTIRSRWSEVIGREKDVASLVTGAQYSMNWDRTEQRLDSAVDSRGLQALSESLRFSACFSAGYREDMHKACHGLSPKRLEDVAADVWSLALHLGVLMAIAGSEPNVRYWFDQGTETITAMAEAHPLAYQHIESLHALFHVQLTDALDSQEATFVEGLDDVAAGILASRLDMGFNTASATAKEDLRKALAKARQVVLNVYQSWTAKQKKRFKQKTLNGLQTQMQAIVSKAPAAFFAKEATGLCTSSNTEMWQEKRHSHLLVFAPGQRRLAGMALLYFERVPALDADRDTLIIRAINPVRTFLATHTVSSIVDAYFDVAIRIAQANDLAAVAFPTPLGMHLMSNHQDIEGEIDKRFIKRATHWAGTFEKGQRLLTQPHRVTANFYAYKTGEVRVDTLYTVWHSKECEKKQLAVT